MCIQRCMEIYLNLVRYNRNSLLLTKIRHNLLNSLNENFYHDICYTFIDHHVFMNSISVIKPLSIQHCTFILPVCQRRGVIQSQKMYTIMCNEVDK